MCLSHSFACKYIRELEDSGKKEKYLNCVLNGSGAILLRMIKLDT